MIAPWSRYLAFAVIVLVVGCAKNEHQPGADESPTNAPMSDSDPEAGTAVAEVLSRLAEDPLALMAEASREEFGALAREGVPEGSEVQTDPETWVPDGSGGGIINIVVTPPGGEPTKYLVVMELEDGEWKVAGTFEVGQ